MSDQFESLTREQLLELLRQRERQKKLGLVWERNEIGRAHCPQHSMGRAHHPAQWPLLLPGLRHWVRGRSTRDQIALLEIKDDGVTGRLNSDESNLKAQVQHMEYRKPFWAARGDDRVFERMDWVQDLRRINAVERFQTQKLVFI